MDNLGRDMMYGIYAGIGCACLLGMCIGGAIVYWLLRGMH